MNILDLRSVEDARRLRLSDIGDRLLTEDEFKHIFGIFNALWVYQGPPNPEVPHAITRDGKCTDGFINCMAVLEYINLCEIMANQLVLRLKEYYRGDVGLVIDAAYSGTDLGAHVARLWGNELGCAHRTVEKDAAGNPTVWRGTVSPDQMILVVNELMTTKHGSTQMAKNAVLPHVDPNQFVPVAGLLVNRSKEDDELEDGTRVVSVGRYKLATYEPGPATCPYCAVGSPSYKPKQENNWALYFSNSAN